MSSEVNTLEKVAGEVAVDTASGHLLTSEFWNVPLERFSIATGMTVSLYDDFAVRQAGPFGKSPIFESIAKTGFFSQNRMGLAIETQSVMQTVATGALAVHSFLGVLGFCTAPIFVYQKLVGVLVVGWVPNNFADAVSSFRVAEAVGLPEMDIWSAIRMQQPMTSEKMIVNVEMLQNFVEAILLQLKIKEEDQLKARKLEVLTESVVALSKAESLQEIASAVVRAAEKLIPQTKAELIIYGETKSEERVRDRDKAACEVFKIDARERALPIYNTRFPVHSASGVALGYLEIVSPDADISYSVHSDLTSLAAQTAVAIQKTRLIEALHEERKSIDNANAELRALHRMKDEFLATISHELRTPLNSILGWSQILNEEMLPPEELADATAAIERNARIQAKLIEDLLDVSRIISGKMNLERNLIDLREILERSIETVRPTSEAKSQDLELEMPAGQLLVRGDPTRLQQVFWNILSNSVKFTPDHGTLRIALKQAGGYAKILISDNGRGIPKDFMPHLFDRFSQADGSNTRKFGGLGLGLAIVRHIVELHGGSIAARSDGEGMGSTFAITIPVNLSESELDSARTIIRDMDYGMEGGRSQLKGMKILAVDDEADSLHLVTFVLEKVGAKVRAVSSAQEALQSLKEWRPDLIVSDISMPGLDGYSLLKQIRMLSLADGGSTPAIALTSFAGEQNKKNAMDAGFQRHFPKPLDPKKLLASIRDFSNYH